MRGRSEQIRELAYWMSAACSSYFILKEDVSLVCFTPKKQRHRIRGATDRAVA